MSNYEALTPNFALNEFTRSETALKLGIDNTPSKKHKARILATAIGLEQVRALLYDNRITIHSGYRCPELNDAVGGVITSDHALGWAADITVATYDTFTAAAEIVRSPLVFDQLIYEKSRGIIHISFNPKLRRQILTQLGPAGTPFQKGLVNS